MPYPSRPSAFDPDAVRQKRAPQASLQKHLAPQETLLWQGAPDPSLRAKAALPAFFFGLPWLVFALFWEVSALTPLAQGEAGSEALPWAAAIVLPLFGLPFIGIGFWLLGKPFAAHRRAKRTRYGLTNLRALIIEDGALPRFYALADLAQPVLRESAKGYGDIIFGKKDPQAKTAERGEEESGFFSIQNPQAVQEKMSEKISRAPRCSEN